MSLALAACARTRGTSCWRRSSPDCSRGRGARAHGRGLAAVAPCSRVAHGSPVLAAAAVLTGAGLAQAPPARDRRARPCVRCSGTRCGCAPRRSTARARPPRARAACTCGWRADRGAASGCGCACATACAGRRSRRGRTCWFAAGWCVSRPSKRSSAAAACTRRSSCARRRRPGPAAAACPVPSTRFAAAPRRAWPPASGRARPACSGAWSSGRTRRSPSRSATTSAPPALRTCSR